MRYGIRLLQRCFTDDAEPFTWRLSFKTVILSVLRNVAIPSHKAIHCRGDALIYSPIPCLFNLKYSIWLRRLCLLSAGINFRYNSRVLCTFVLNSCFRKTGVAFWQHQTVSRSEEQEEGTEINTRFAGSFRGTFCLMFQVFALGFTRMIVWLVLPQCRMIRFFPPFRRNLPNTHLKQIQSTWSWMQHFLPERRCRRIVLHGVDTQSTCM